MDSARASRRGRVFVVEDDPHVRFGMAAALRAAGYEVFEAGSCEDTIARFRDAAPDVVVTDLRLPDGNSVDLLPRLQALDPSVSVFIVTGYGSIEVAVAAVKHGAEDFLTKPVDMDHLLALVGGATARRAAAAESTPLPRARSGFRSASPRMRELEQQVEKLRDADCTVLILGETGTGKSVLARRIHDIGSRARGPFVDVNCAGLTREMVESELFGHERGAFTGAHTTKAGLLDAADNGTLFLDEIGDIDVQVQPKVLKVLEEKRFRRMGNVKEREVDVRLVLATHRDLVEAVGERTFRADLYYRISTVTLCIPPLRERAEDILPLARTMLLARGGGDVDLAPDAEDKLLYYGWPGNIRELKNVIERAVFLRTGPMIHAVDLPLAGAHGRPRMASGSDATRTASGSDAARVPPGSEAFAGNSEVIPVPSLREPHGPPSSSGVHASHASHASPRLLADDASTATRDEIEREHIRLALEAEGGKVEAAARRLGMPRSTLYQRLKTLGIATLRRPTPRPQRAG